MSNKMKVFIIFLIASLIGLAFTIGYEMAESKYRNMVIENYNNNLKKAGFEDCSYPLTEDCTNRIYNNGTGINYKILGDEK